MGLLSWIKKETEQHNKEKNRKDNPGFTIGRSNEPIYLRTFETYDVEVDTLDPDFLATHEFLGFDGDMPVFRKRK